MGKGNYRCSILLQPPKQERTPRCQLVRRRHAIRCPSVCVAVAVDRENPKFHRESFIKRTFVENSLRPARSVSFEPLVAGCSGTRGRLLRVGDEQDAADPRERVQPGHTHSLPCCGCSAVSGVSGVAETLLCAASMSSMVWSSVPRVCVARVRVTAHHRRLGGGAMRALPAGGEDW